MPIKPSFESATREGVTIVQTSTDCDHCLQNYSHFGWKMESRSYHPVYDDNGKPYDDTDLYDLTMVRDKTHPNYKRLVQLEDDYLLTKNEIKARKEGVLASEKLNADYLDYNKKYFGEEVYKLSVGKVILYLVLSCCIIGLLCWVGALKHLLIDNKRVVKNEKMRLKALDIFAQADKLL